jgi:hypothetical protein
MNARSLARILASERVLIYYRYFGEPVAAYPGFDKPHQRFREDKHPEIIGYRNKGINMLKVYSARNPTEAHLLKGILASYGIACEVRGESLFGLRGEVPLTPDTAPSVWILDDADNDEAGRILKGYEKSNMLDGSDKESWICRYCGEDSEGQFTKCWNCGRPRLRSVK